MIDRRRPGSVSLNVSESSLPQSDDVELMDNLFISKSYIFGSVSQSVSETSLP